MPYKWTEPELMVDHNDVQVYRTYKDSQWNDPMTYWYNTSQVEEEEFEFDIRELPGYSADTPLDVSQLQHHANILMIAIEQGHIGGSEE